MSIVMTSFSNWFFNDDVMNRCVEISKISTCMLFFHTSHIRPNLTSNFCNHRCSEHFKKILCISKVFGSWSGGIEILTMIGVQKCQFLAESES